MTASARFQIVGEEKLHCAGCESRIGRALSQMEGVEDVEASAETQVVGVRYDPHRVAPNDVGRRLEDMGYEVTPIEPGAPSTSSAG